ncbi:MAG TPA: uroporphyrinogen-III synthase [Chitinophagales bacterium]|nr:uroporphyrinogen-III synthase [Chitinophagales bacterium]
MKLMVEKNTRQVKISAEPSANSSKPINGNGAKPNIKSILITQPKPENDKNPYFELAKKHNISVEFKPFIHLEGVSAKEFRKQKINPAEYSALIFTSRSAVDQFFKLCDVLRVRMSPDAKYYCMTEAIALYLQKYILFRKRKVFFGDGTFQGLTEIIEKHRDGEKFLMPCSDNHKSDTSDYLRKKKYEFAEAVIFKTVSVELTEEEIRKYDMVVFFTPTGVNALMYNFPEFEQKSIKIGAFGPFTSQAVIDAGLHLDLQAPAPQSPSMTMAIDNYLSGII